MPHIHTGKNEHDLTVTGFVVRTDGDEPRILMHMHRKFGVLMPIGGHVELLETPWQAITHELEEESGYALEQVKVLQPRSRMKTITKAVQTPYPLGINIHDVPQDHFHTDIAYGFVTETDPRHEIGYGESKDIRWLTRAELNDLDETQVFDNVKDVYGFLLDEALIKWEMVETSDFLLTYPDEFKKTVRITL